MAASQDNCGSNEQAVPQWKRELILRRRALAKTLPAGNSSVQLTCPSVVTAVRQAGEIVSDPCTFAISTSPRGPADSPVLYFHPEEVAPPCSSADEASVAENMRLVEHHDTPGLRRSLPIGVDLENSKTIDAVAYRSIMGEEKSVKKSCASNRKMENNKAVKNVLVVGENGKNHANEDECLSDSSEELQYGPGIVNKLKSKYMSMTLRENKNKKVRPSLSQMRRAASMENMLDDSEAIDKGKPPLIKPQHKYTKRTEVTSNAATNKYQSQQQQRFRSISRGNDSIKRARSVEALLCYEGKSPPSVVVDARKNLLKSLSKDEIIIVEKTPAPPPVEKPPVPVATRKKRPTMNGQAKTGMPPADVVKQTLKLFENAGTTPPKPPKLNIGIANKPLPAAKPLLSPKPSPEKIRRSPLVKTPPKKTSPPPPVEAEQKPSVKEQAPLTPELQIQRKLPGTIDIRPKSPTEVLRSPPSRVLPLDLNSVQTTPPAFTSQSSPKLLKSPSQSAIPDGRVTSPTNGAVKLSPVKPRTPSPLARVKSPSPLRPRNSSPDLSSPEPKPRTVSPRLTASPIARTPSPVSNGTSDIVSSDDEEDTTKTVSGSSMDNIRKGGSTEVFSFCSKTASDKSKSYLPANRSQTSPVSPKAAPVVPTPPARHPSPISPLPVTKSPEMPSTKQVGIIRPLVSLTSPKPAALTDREKEKNHINSVKSSADQPTKVIASIKTSEVVVGNVSEALKGRVVEDKAPKEVKTVVRDVVNTKSPGLWDNKKSQQSNVLKFDFTNRKDPIPDYIENAGIILPTRREPIRPGDSGFIILDPSLEDSSATDETDDFNACFLGPPSPCNVRFEGDNIVINGKSSLRASKAASRKLRIKFKEATETFEYPSESSMLNDMLAASSAAASASASASTSAAGPAPGLPVPSGGGSLASYTSKSSHGGEDFQLGVTRTTPLPRPKPEPAVEQPGSVEESVAWSTDTADDLLF